MSIAIVFRTVVAPNFRAPAILLIAVAVTATALTVWALTRKTALAEPEKGNLPAAISSPWVAGAIALVAAGLWMWLFTLPQILRIGFRPLLPMILAAYLAWGVYRLVHSWSGGWTDLHLLAVIGGAVLASAAYGIDVVKQASPLDRAGQAVCSIVLLSGLAAMMLRRKMQANRLPAPSVL
jgi:hypothetical protein